VWLVQRLDGSPARHILHRWPGFRRLAEVYGRPE
jgi:hypothetical protein